VVVDQAVPAVPPSLHEHVSRTRRAMILNVTIDASGRVKDAVVIVSINPVYDRMVLDASSRWRYRPATKNGAPVPYVKSLAIAVR
jgi:TonB family protein